MILYLILLILVVICQWVCKTVVLIRVSYFRVLIFFLWIPNRGNLEFPKTSLYWFSFSLFSNKMAFFIPRQAADEARHLIRRHQSFCRACVRPRLRVISGLPVPGARAFSPRSSTSPLPAVSREHFKSHLPVCHLSLDCQQTPSCWQDSDKPFTNSSKNMEHLWLSHLTSETFWK